MTFYGPQNARTALKGRGVEVLTVDWSAASAANRFSVESAGPQ